jgi:hypothetical protein
LRGLFKTLRIYDQSLFCLTRRAISAGGFFTTIHSITDVAAARAYLDGGIRFTAWIGVQELDMIRTT